MQQYLACTKKLTDGYAWNQKQ